MLSCKSFIYLVFSVVLLQSMGCSSSDTSGGGCDIVANPDGPAFFKVQNNLSTGLTWFLPPYPLAADMKPGECTIMGVASSQYTVEIQQCNIADAACTSYFGVTKFIVFSVGQGETYTLTVDSNTFN